MPYWNDLEARNEWLHEATNTQILDLFEIATIQIAVAKYRQSPIESFLTTIEDANALKGEIIARMSGRQRR